MPLFSTKFTIHLITQKSAPRKAGSKAAPQVTKCSKTKETRFLANKTDYLTFLIMLLSKHGERRYKVTDKRYFSVKYRFPPARNKLYTQVDNETEYETMVGKILEKKPTRVIVCIDMTDVENGCRNDPRNSDNSDGDKVDADLEKESANTSAEHYHYERRFPEGGGTRYNGPPMVKGDRRSHDDHTTYWDEGRRKMVPIPNGYTAPRHDSPDP